MINRCVVLSKYMNMCISRMHINGRDDQCPILTNSIYKLPPPQVFRWNVPYRVDLGNLKTY